MATSQVLHQVTIEDADGNRKSLPLYFEYDTGTATLSGIITYAAVNLGTLDPIIDGQIVSHSITLVLSLPTSGIKTAPVAGSNVQESGLITYLTDAPVKRAYGQDIPAFAQSKFAQKEIDLADTEVSDWTDRMLATGGVLVATNQDFLAHLASVRSGIKTFRKQRR